MKGLVVAGLTVLVSFPAFGQFLRADIQQARSSLDAAFAAGNFPEIDQLYAADAIVLPPHGKMVRGRPAIEQYWTKARSAGLADISFLPVDVSSTGDVAREVGYLQANFIGPQRTSVHVTGHYVALWKDTWSGWKLETEIWNASFWP